MEATSNINAPVDGDWVSSDQYMDVIRKNDSLRSSYQILLDKHQQLERLHQELEHEYRDLEVRAVALRKQHKDDKNLMKDWKAYIDKCYESGKLQPRGVSAIVEEASLATPRTLNRESSGDHAKTPTAGLPTKPLERPLTHPAIEAARAASRSSSVSGSGVNRITSSQTTQGDILSSEPHIREDDDELPVVVSTRNLKRKRFSPGKGRNPHQGTPAQPLSIKEESRSSPLLAQISRAHLLRTETSDLDVLQTDATAPKQKSRKLSDGKLHLYQQTGRWARSTSRQLLDPDAMDTTNENDAPQIDPMAENERLGVITPQRRFRDAAVDDTFQIKAEPGVHDNDQTPRAQFDHSQGRISQRQTSGPLQPLSTNTPTLPRTSPYESKTTKSKKRNQGAGAVHLLTEDGESVVRTAKETRASRTESERKPAMIHRLDDLLEHGTSPGLKPAVTPRSTAAARRRIDPHATPSVEQPATSRRRNAPQNSQSPRKSLALDDDDPDPVLPEHEPLRSRPLQRLSLDDFKINPAFNDYRGYAYNETVRKKAERHCLPGCTRECCADIRRFAEAGLLPSVPRKRGLFDSSQDDIDDDELTLQGYLGFGYKRMTKGATAEQKKKMLVDARAKAFADQHGKHRQVYERRNTPPGFWRTDMPTTQEDEEDKAEALKQERQKVEERWREAMRGGSRYVFRDE